MAYHSGTLINGDPVICGGFDGVLYGYECFQYQRSTKNWKKVIEFTKLHFEF